MVLWFVSAGTGWVHTSGKDNGALGDGWYKKKINLTPYTISTATTGSCAFVELDVISPNSSLRDMATNGTQFQAPLSPLHTTLALLLVELQWVLCGCVCGLDMQRFGGSSIPCLMTDAFRT